MKAVANAIVWLVVLVYALLRMRDVDWNDDSAMTRWTVRDWVLGIIVSIAAFMAASGR